MCGVCIPTTGGWIMYAFWEYWHAMDMPSDKCWCVVIMVIDGDGERGHGVTYILTGGKI